MIKTEIVGHSLSPQGDELISVLCTFPRIILAEVNTHRMLSKNTSSSRAIPFKKMVEAVQNNPFIPIAWQKSHSGMQGTEYFDDGNVESLIQDWLRARDQAISSATFLTETGATKQLANRLLEPFMWTTMLITGSKEGWDNFFNLRCPQYQYTCEDGKVHHLKSKKEWRDMRGWCVDSEGHTWACPVENPKTDLDWLQLNKGQAEIHIMDLAEKIYDALNESNPTQLLPGMYHILFRKQINELYPDVENDSEDVVKISVSMAARTSYTIVGDEKEISKEKHIDLHDRLISQNPPHSSPLEHCARAMNDAEYESFYKGQIGLGGESGWCRNFKGFIQYRHIIETQNK